MERLAFATMVAPSSLAKETLMLIESLRTFGGELANASCITLVPKGAEPLSDEIKERLSALNVRLVPFDLDEEAKQFPLASIVYASAEAEEQTRGKTEILVWMHPDTLVINPPMAFLLPKAINYGYRPVHHTRIGSIYEKPLDNFWSLIYEHCEVPESQVFPMETGVRDNVLRPYFNAGMLVLRPEQGLLRTWRERFEGLYRHPDFKPLFEKDQVYEVFMHQAVLAAVILKLFKRQDMLKLPETINYALNLHDEYPSKLRPKTLSELITCRYEDIEELAGLLKGIPVEEPLKSWLNERLKIM